MAHNNGSSHSRYVARWLAGMALMLAGPPLTWLAILWSNPVASGLRNPAFAYGLAVGGGTGDDRSVMAPAAAKLQMADPAALSGCGCVRAGHHACLFHLHREA